MVFVEQTISIEVEVDSLEKNNNIVGNIYFVIDHHRYFPDEGWSDFVIIILSWWIHSLKGLINSEVGRTYLFDFMDGTPVVRAKKVNESNIEMSFEFHREHPEIKFTSICRLEELRNSLLSVSKKVLRAVERNSWRSEDINQLKDLTLSLERYPFNN